MAIPLVGEVVYVPVEKRLVETRIIKVSAEEKTVTVRLLFESRIVLRDYPFDELFLKEVTVSYIPYKFKDG